MYITNFCLKYPKLAKKETRIVTLLTDNEKIPKGEYEIQEFYCTDPNCDCRKVSLNVIGSNGKLYYLDYGFEDYRYYMDWGIGNIYTAKKMSGLSVNSLYGDYSESELILDTMKWVLSDEKYIERLKKHYFLMKENVDRYEDPTLSDNEDFVLIDDDNDILNNNNRSEKFIKRKLKDKKKKKLVKKQKRKLKRRK